MTPIDGPDRLAVTVDASVRYVDGSAGLLRRRSQPKDLRGRHISGDIRPNDHHKDYGGQDAKRT